VLAARRFNVESLFDEAPVELVDVRLARQDEADVERPGVAHRLGAADTHQREHEIVVVERLGMWLSFTAAPSVGMGGPRRGR